MSGPIDRKAALRAYKERRPRPGIYAVRQIATGQQWVDKALQAAWTAHGEAAFDYVVLEVIEENLEPVFLKDWLKARKAHWAALEQARQGHP